MNNLRTIEAQIVQKLKNNEPRPKITGSFKTEKCVIILAMITSMTFGKSLIMKLFFYTC